MTVQEIIDKVNILRRNNPFTIKDVMRWLNQCEARIQRECLLMPKVVAVYDVNNDADEVLIAEPPYDELYIYYICAKIDEALGEEERYNNTITRYNDVHKDYQRYLVKTYDPAHNKISIVRDDPIIFQGSKVEITIYGLPVQAEEITSAKILLTQKNTTKEYSNVTADKDTLSVVLVEAESYALEKGTLYIGYDIEAGGYKYKETEVRKFHVKLSPELKIIADGEEGSPVDASLTIPGRAADAAATSAAIEKRAADYGLGAEPKVYILNELWEIDNLPINGFYYLKFNKIITISSYEFLECGCYISGLDNANRKVELWLEDNANESGAYIVRRTTDGVTTGSWEWENPPMIAGVEYRTTERHNGDVVYAKLIKITEIPQNGGVNVPHGISNCRPISCVGCSDGTALTIPYMSSTGAYISVAANTGSIVLYSNYNPGLTAIKVLLKYYKA